MTAGVTDFQPDVAYELPPEAGYAWPPEQWMPPLYDHQLDYTAMWLPDQPVATPQENQE